MIVPRSPYIISLNWSVYIFKCSSFKDSEHILTFPCEGPTTEKKLWRVINLEITSRPRVFAARVQRTTSAFGNEPLTHTFAERNYNRTSDRRTPTKEGQRVLSSIAIRGADTPLSPRSPTISTEIARWKKWEWWSVCRLPQYFLQEKQFIVSYWCAWSNEHLGGMKYVQQSQR
jgi:hypothetical protein